MENGTFFDEDYFEELRFYKKNWRKDNALSPVGKQIRG